MLPAIEPVASSAITNVGVTSVPIRGKRRVLVIVAAGTAPLDVIPRCGCPERETPVPVPPLPSKPPNLPAMFPRSVASKGSYRVLTAYAPNTLMGAIALLNFGLPVVKKPAHRPRSSQGAQTSGYAFFQSEIDWTAKGRTAAGSTHSGKL
jgi:hypothetical protein